MATEDESPTEFSLEGIQDVQDFVSGNDFELLDTGRSNHLYDLMKLHSETIVMRRLSTVTRELIISNQMILSFLATDVLLISGKDFVGILPPSSI